VRPLGGKRIKRILRSRLPERLSGRLPPLAVEVGVGLGLTMLMALARLALVPWTGEAAPFALVFVAIVGAALLAGWRSGLVALVAGQLLIWVFVMEPTGSFGAKDSAQVGALAMATLAQLLSLAIVTLYQHEIERAWSRRESQMGLLEKALKEIDHRTSNNYQTVLALVLAQAKSAREKGVKDALQQVADRIRAIASASRKLAVASEGLEQVRIAEHLQDLCVEIERGLARPGIAVHCHFDDLVLDADDAVCVSILVNELVTNSLKHAFPDERAGTIEVSLAVSGDGLQLKVADDGVGLKAGGRTRGGGLGTRLIETFTRQLKARHEIESDPSGTRHLVRIPPPKTQAARPRRSSRTSAIAPASMVES
jgi:two-component sensor histidine kinase